MAKFTSEYVHGGSKAKADITVIDEDDDNSQFSVDLGNDDDDLDIELIEDDDKPAKELADEELDGDEELKQYSSGVKKRIAKEVGRRHEAERRASQRERDAADAIAYAKQVIEENEKLKKTSASIQRTAVDVTTASLQKNVDNIKARLKQAADDGDTNAQVDLQAELNQAQMDLRDAKNADARLKEHETALEADDNNDKPVVTQPRTETKLSQVQIDWFEANKGWFKTDDEGRPLNEASEEALFLNAKAIRAGKDPSSKEFYEEINARLAREYPDLDIPTPKKGKKKNEDDDFTAPRPSFSRSGGAGASKPKGKVVLSAREMRVIENLCPPHADKKEFIKRYIANKPKEDQ